MEFTKEQLFGVSPKERTQAEAEWIDAYENILGFKVGAKDRPVIITPYLGRYGIAGTMIVIEGTPMRATMCIKFGKDKIGSMAESAGSYQMYVLHSMRTPLVLKTSPGKKVSLKREQLWNATVSLLTSRGILRD